MGAPRNRGMRQKSEKLAQRKRGAPVAGTRADKVEGYTVGPWLLGFFLFVVVGSAAVEVLRILSQDNTPNRGGE